MSRQRWISSVVFVAGLGFVGCASRQAPSGLELMSESEFQTVMERYSDRSQKYDGLYNTLDISTTLRNSAVVRAQLEQNARLYQWDRAKFQLESNKAAEKMKTETEIFLAFYTPERKNDDLAKANSQWRIYLEAGGRRWEGKVGKLRTAPAEIQSMYPTYTRFASPYVVTFPVATKSVEAAEAKFTITGPVGMTSILFAPVGTAESKVPETTADGSSTMNQ